MELRHLRYFVAVAEELNVRQAAARLHLSQPPLSRQIHDLEDEVGTKLFVRSKSGMRLTEAGRTFLKEARSILAQSQRAVQLAQAASRGARPKIVPRLLCVHCDLGDVPHLGWWKMRRRKPARHRT
jgi:DNA-binding transcriptional LysR family regulator